MITITNPIPAAAVGTGIVLIALGVGVALGNGMQPDTPPACGATGPLVAVLREVDPDVACTLTGTIMNARIELVEGE